MGVKPLDRQVVHAATTFAFSLGLRQTGSVVPRSRYAFVPNASKKARATGRTLCFRANAADIRIA